MDGRNEVKRRKAAATWKMPVAPLHYSWDGFRFIFALCCLHSVCVPILAHPTIACFLTLKCNENQSPTMKI